MFIEFERLIYNLKVLLANIQNSFYNTDEGIFVKEILHRILEESSGYIADLKQGAFFASYHHLRALIELFATAIVIDIDSKNNYKKNYLGRFSRFAEIEFYKLYHKKDATLLLPQELLDKLELEKCSELDDDLLLLFNKKNKQELLKMQNWRGNCTITNLLEQCPDNQYHLKNYQQICLCIHISGIIMRSQIPVFPQFGSAQKNMLTLMVRYVTETYLCLKNREFAGASIIKNLEDVFL